MDETFEATLAAHRPWIAMLAFTILREGVPPLLDHDDLVAAGMVGFWEAFQRYDPAKGKFKTFAATRVTGAMRDEVRGMSFLSRNDRDQGCTASFVDVTDETEVEGRAFAADLIAFAIWREETGGDIRADDVHIDDLALDALSHRERLVIEACLEGGPGWAKRLAAEWGVTESRVSQVYHSALQILRQRVGGRPAEKVTDWLSGKLSGGPVTRREIKERARMEGVGLNALSWAYKRLGVRTISEKPNCYRVGDLWTLGACST